MKCHIQCLDEATQEFSLVEKLPNLVLRNLLFTYRKFRKVKSTYGTKTESDKPVISSLNLKAGERVRVKSLEQIKMTLDKDNKYQGLSFFAPMEKYCGGTYIVFKRVEKIFNERKWRMSKIRNVVLLDGVFCDGVGGIEKSWDGCDRSCYLWWKEVWLERVSE